MNDKKKALLLGIVAVVAVAAALFVGVKSSSGSGETVTDFKAVPAKGIGKADRD